MLASAHLRISGGSLSPNIVTEHSFMGETEGVSFPTGTCEMLYQTLQLLTCYGVYGWVLHALHVRADEIYR